MKKFTAVFLSAVLALSLLCFSVSAAYDAENALDEKTSTLEGVATADLAGLGWKAFSSGSIEIATEEGNSYEQYLQMMLVLKSKEELSMRALDLVEMNLRSGMEKTFFRADACISGADFDMTCYLRRGIRYQYHILYQYQ